MPGHFFHRGDHLQHRGGRFLRRRGERLDVVGDLADAAVELVDGLVGLVDDRALFIDAIDDGAGARSDGIRHVLELGLGADDLRQRLLQIAGHAVEGPGELADLVTGGDVGALRQVAAGDDARRFRQLLDGTDDDPRREQRQQPGHEERQERDQHSGKEQLVPRGARLRLVHQHPEVALRLVSFGEGAHEEVHRSVGCLERGLARRDTRKMLRYLGRAGGQRFAVGRDEVDVVD